LRHHHRDALRKHRDADSPRIPVTRGEQIYGQERTDAGLRVSLKKIDQIEASEAAAILLSGRLFRLVHRGARLLAAHYP
jgi:hypothetical protein